MTVNSRLLESPSRHLKDVMNTSGNNVNITTIKSFVIQYDCNMTRFFVVFVVSSTEYLHTQYTRTIYVYTRRERERERVVKSPRDVDF